MPTYGEGVYGSGFNGIDPLDLEDKLGLNQFDGSGRGVMFASKTAVSVKTGTLSPELFGSARGLISTSTGTIKVKLMDGAIVQMPVFEGKDCIFNIHTIYADGVGDVPIADITLIW